MVLTQSAIRLKAGDRAPGFDLKGIDGKMHTPGEFSKSKAVLIVFMCNHCPYVKARLESIKEVHKKFRDNGVAVIGINSNDPNFPEEGFDNMKKFAVERGITFPYLFDETQSVARSYGATCTPDPFLFDSDMRLAFHGRMNDALTLDQTPTEPTMENNISKLLKGEKIEKWFEPSMGCSIKWIE